ncbi:MAG: 2-oxo acid dehydrogenase subunit E2 [Oligoflexia bacterium]|nr:2-oxo acid dehydrogenase subunit E2 [Oligoflexia bacterium]
MPQLSDTMFSGKILVWKKNEGDAIKRGDILAEVETDKANLEIESFNDGQLIKIMVPAQSTAAVGDVIAVIGQPGEVAAVSTSAAAAKSASSAAPPAAKPSPVGAPSSAKILAHPAASSSERIKASPLARKVAAQRNIDISALHGTGPNGRITRKDVEQVSGTSAPSLSAASAPRSASQRPAAAPSAEPGAGTLRPLSKMRDTIARRMQQSVTEAPHFYSTISIRMDQALALREVLKARDEYKGLSVNHFIIKAAAYALSHEPRVNCAMRDGQLFEPASINIGIITAIEDGLLIPVIRETDRLALKDLVFEARAAVERARAGRPSSADLMGGTFSISNMGMFEVENFTAIINPGQGAVLAVSAVQQLPVVEQGQITIGKIMKATLSVDHRIIDGLMAATWLKHFKEALELPALMTV